MSDSDDDVPIAALKSKKPTAKKSVAASGSSWERFIYVN